MHLMRWFYQQVHHTEHETANTKSPANSVLRFMIPMIYARVAGMNHGYKTAHSTGIPALGNV